MSKKQYKIPFLNGKMLEYTQFEEGNTVDYVSLRAPTEWRDNTEFSARIQVTGTYRGRSAARITCKNLDNGESYSMGLSAFYDAVIGFGSQQTGIIKGNWTFRKQGANFGLYPITDK